MLVIRSEGFVICVLEGGSVRIDQGQVVYPTCFHGKTRLLVLVLALERWL